MSFEAEVIPLFIGGCTMVCLVELAAGWSLLKEQRQVRGFFTGHVLAMAVGLFFLVRCLFGDRLHLIDGIASIDHSVSVGLFGVFWMASVLLLLAALRQKNPSFGDQRPRL